MTNDGKHSEGAEELCPAFKTILDKDRENVAAARRIVQALNLVVHDVYWTSQPAVHVRCGAGIDAYGAKAAIEPTHQPADSLVFQTADGKYYTFRKDLATCPECARAIL